MPMVEPEKAKPGLPVTVRQKPLVVNGQTFGSRPFKGIVAALDPKGKGAYVTRPSGGQHFATWEEMSPRRLKEGEE